MKLSDLVGNTGILFYFVFLFSEVKHFHIFSNHLSLLLGILVFLSHFSTGVFNF